MKALVCDEPGRLTLAERPDPARGDGEVLVRIRHVGICGTDFHIFGGKHPFLEYPRVMGHELSGTVQEAPPGSALKPGDPVYIVPYLSCGTCHACRLGADAVLLADANAEENARRLTGSDWFDVVVDASGAAAPIQRGFGFLAHGARYVLLSVVRDSLTFSDPEFHKREATLLASRNAQPEDFAEVVRQMQAGRIPTRALNTHRGQLADAVDLFSEWSRPEAGVIKAILDL